MLPVFSLLQPAAGHNAPQGVASAVGEVRPMTVETGPDVGVPLGEEMAGGVGVTVTDGGIVVAMAVGGVPVVVAVGKDVSVAVGVADAVHVAVLVGVGAGVTSSPLVVSIRLPWGRYAALAGWLTAGPPTTPPMATISSAVTAMRSPCLIMGEPFLVLSSVSSSLPRMAVHHGKRAVSCVRSPSLTQTRQPTWRRRVLSFAGCIAGSE